MYSRSYGIVTLDHQELYLIQRVMLMDPLLLSSITVLDYHE